MLRGLRYNNAYSIPSIVYAGVGIGVGQVCFKRYFSNTTNTRIVSNTSPLIKEAHRFDYLADPESGTLNFWYLFQGMMVGFHLYTKCDIVDEQLVVPYKNIQIIDLTHVSKPNAMPMVKFFVDESNSSLIINQYCNPLLQCHWDQIKEGLYSNVKFSNFCNSEFWLNGERIISGVQGIVIEE